MKVAVITHTMPRYAGDAAAAFMTGLGNGMLKAGLDVVFVAPWHPQFGRNPQQQFKTTTYHYFPIRSLEVFGYSGTLYSDIKIRPLQMFLAPFVILFGVLTLLKLVKQKKIDVISAHWLVPGGLIAAIVKLFTHGSTSLTMDGHPTIHVSLPGSDVFLAQRNPIVRPLALWAARSADLITTNSPQLAKDLRELGLGKEITPLIYGVNPSEFKTNFGGRNKMREQVVLGVGRMVKKKGFHHLLNSFAQLVKRFPDTKLILVGDGDEKANLKQQADQLGIANKVDFPGFLAPVKLKKLYQKVSIFVLPSIRDQAGNLDDQSVAAVEAMASGLPTVTTNFPGYRLTIDHGKTGFLFPEGDEQALENILTQLLGDPKERDRIGRAAREAVEKKFSTAAIGRQYKKLFEQIIREK